VADTSIPRFVKLLYTPLCGASISAPTTSGSSPGWCNCSTVRGKDPKDRAWIARLSRHRRLRRGRRPVRDRPGPGPTPAGRVRPVRQPGRHPHPAQQRPKLAYCSPPVAGTRYPAPGHDRKPWPKPHPSRPRTRSALPPQRPRPRTLARPGPRHRAPPRRVRLCRRTARRWHRAAAVPAALRRLRQPVGLCHLSGKQRRLRRQPRPVANPSAPPKKPSTAPAASTSTTPPPGAPSNPRRTYQQGYLGLAEK
jgi:hypothetical protein